MASDTLKWAAEQTDTPQKAYNAASDYASDLAGAAVSVRNPWGDGATEAIVRWPEFADAERMYRVEWLRAAAGYLGNLADTLEGH